jgi:hypothetical protein
MYIYVYYVCVCVCLWYNITYLYIYVTVMLRIRGMLSNVSEQNPFCTQRRIWESPSPFSSGQLARQLFCHSSDFTGQTKIIQIFSVKIDINLFCIITYRCTFMCLGVCVDTRINVCRMRRRIHKCHMRRRIHGYTFMCLGVCMDTRTSTHKRSNTIWTGVRKLHICFRVRVWKN